MSIIYNYSVIISIIMKCKCVVFVLPFLLTWIDAQKETCTTPLGMKSQCVVLYDCPQLLTPFSERPLPSYVVSYLRQSHCGFEDTTPKVCCGPLPPRPTTKPAIDKNKEFAGSSDSFVNEDSQPTPPGQCGLDTNGNRIFGGNLTDLDEFPWMALCGYRTKTGKITYQCGGVLINKRYVLTAAHCLIGAVEKEVGELVTVRLGEYNLDTQTDCVDGQCSDPPQDIPVEAKYPHPAYIDGNKNRVGDIGLIRLARRATFSYYVQPICLADPNQYRLDVGTNLFVAGWGKTLNGRNSPVKLKLSLPVYDKESCISKYRTLGAEISDNQICAGGAFAQDACRGDSGGPLMRIRRDGVWESVGVISFGYGCGRDGWPGVYTSVAGHLPWILNEMRSTNV